MKRSRHIQIYLKPGIREDDLMLRIWESCRRNDRPQDVFRAMLRNGMRAMVQSGEMPYAVVEECNLDSFIERWQARRPAKHAAHVSPAFEHSAPSQPDTARTFRDPHPVQERETPPPRPASEPAKLQESRGVEKPGLTAPSAVAVPPAPDVSHNPMKEDGANEKKPKATGKRIGNLM